jgi:hypothetical protein
MIRKSSIGMEVVLLSAPGGSFDMNPLGAADQPKA